MSNKKLNIFILIFTFICIVALITLYIFIPKIKLDKRSIDINVFSKYEPINYKATYLGKDVTDEVKVSGEVDTDRVGKYKITYRVKEGIFNVRKYLTVNVVDKVSPELELIGDEELKVCSAKLFIEPGYSAIDNYDGDITSEVSKKYVDINKIEYSIKDTSNNVTKKYRTLIETDDEAPEIKLKGNKTLYLTVGSNYKEAGVEVKDNCDEDLLNKVETSGSVDTSKTGTYNIKYTIKDNAGNESSVERKVVVTEVKVEQNPSSNNKTGVIYLTFDDGPSGYTTQILDILAKYNIKATFFVTLSGSDNLIKREYDEGHTVALHTATHNYKQMYASVDAYFADLNAVSERVKRITGQESKIIRFPGGASNTISRRYSQGIMTRLTSKVLAQGYKYYDWNVSSGDAGSTTDPNQVYLNVVNGLRRDRVNMVLMHDIKPYTRDALARIIDYCKNNGYPMERITMSTEMITQRVNN